ncbi:MAG: hypothetical protein EOO04_34760 [Chitinophagaceae bacterium]|nr:MAG: hypothetical protein EOO04_34760 [Chitinophagaceae bacterium]
MQFNSFLAAVWLSVLTIITSCHQTAPATKTAQASVTGKSTGNNLISFKVNGQQVNSSGWTISRFSLSDAPSGQWLNITSNMHDEKRVINVNLSGTTPGDYVMGEPGSLNSHSYGSYFPDYLENLTNSYSFSSGAFHITDVDTVKRIVSGTFSGTVKNLKGESFEITEGRIENGTLNTGVIAY